MEILIIFFGIIIGLATYITHGILLKSLFFTFLGFLGLDFGMRFLNDNDDDDDFDGGKMIPVLQRSKVKFLLLSWYHVITSGLTVDLSW